MCAGIAGVRCRVEYVCAQNFEDVLSSFFLSFFLLLLLLFLLLLLLLFLLLLLLLLLLYAFLLTFLCALVALAGSLFIAKTGNLPAKSKTGIKGESTHKGAN